MGQKVFLNGKLVNRDKAVISVFDHGLLYGDGVFEGIRSYSRRVFKLADHIDRLYRSAAKIMLKIHMKEKDLIKAVITTLKANRLDDAYIRLVVTRGPGDLGLDPRKCTKGGTIFIITDKIALYPRKFYDKGLAIVTAKTRKSFVNSINPNIKSLNYLNNILAKIDGIKKGAVEAIMLTYDNYVSECTGDNIFIVKRGRLYTPPRTLTLEGITQGTVMNIAKKRKIAFREKNMRLSDIYTADECFLTGTAAEIVPVVKVDHRVIGKGSPGDITKRLLAEFRQLAKVDGVKY